MTTQLRDLSYLEMSYALAEKARGRTSPNPYVGAVIAKRGEILGWGYHEKAGKPHAEALALQRAGDSARGATAYITLEPCTQWGRTPPCLDAILSSGIKRVVVSDTDANPRVFRKGIERLRAAGLQVSLGLLKERNRSLNEVYIKYITRRIPFVTLKTAASLDGKTATAALDSQWISSRATREYIHLVRGEYDAILVGINTVLKDNPRLTVRHAQWRGKKQTRIILDSRLRFPLTSRLLGTLPRGDILVFAGPEASARKAAALEKKGVRIVTVPRSRGGLKLTAVLTWLAGNGITSVLVEGGGRVHTEFLERRLADKILITQSPKLIGGIHAPSWYQGKGAQALGEALRLRRSRVFSIEDDILIEGYF